LATHRDGRHCDVCDRPELPLRSCCASEIETAGLCQLTCLQICICARDDGIPIQLSLQANFLGRNPARASKVRGADADEVAVKRRQSEAPFGFGVLIMPEKLAFGLAAKVAFVMLGLARRHLAFRAQTFSSSSAVNSRTQT